MRIHWLAVLALGLVPVAGASPVKAVARDDAGSAAGYGQILCGVAPSVIESFKRALDEVDPGASTSALYTSAWTQAVNQVANVRASGSDAELSQTVCPSARATLARRVSF
jgi:hypothetical protein